MPSFRSGASGEGDYCLLDDPRANIFEQGALAQENPVCLVDDPDEPDRPFEEWYTRPFYPLLGRPFEAGVYRARHARIDHAAAAPELWQRSLAADLPSFILNLAMRFGQSPGSPWSSELLLLDLLIPMLPDAQREQFNELWLKAWAPEGYATRYLQAVLASSTHPRHGLPASTLEAARHLVAPGK